VVKIRAGILIALLTANVVPVHMQGRRPMVVDDLFNLQTLSDVRISPDGASIAVVIQRAWSDPVVYRPYEMYGMIRQTSGSWPQMADRQETSPAAPETRAAIGLPSGLPTASASRFFQPPVATTFARTCGTNTPIGCSD
jgi:hypothetical protein